MKSSSLTLFIILMVAPCVTAQTMPGSSGLKAPSASLLKDREEGFSLRIEFEKFGLKPKRQGYYACVVFATLGVLEFDYARAGERVDLSEQFVQWASVEAAGRRYPNFPYKTVIRGIQKYGVCTEELMQYKDPQQDLGVPTEEALKDAASRRRVSVRLFHDYDRSFGFTSAELNQMCKSIATEKPLVCIMRWPKQLPATFQDTYTFDTKHVDAQVTTNDGVIGHAVVFIGYDIDKQWEGGGRFQFRNSHGERWGQGGYGWVTFGYLKKHGVASFAVHPRSR